MIGSLLAECPYRLFLLLLARQFAQLAPRTFKLPFEIADPLQQLGLLL
jgi:hypothetical protein